MDSNKSKSKKRQNGESTEYSKNSIPIEKDRIKATNEKIQTDKHIDTIKKEKNRKFKVQETVESETIHSKRQKSKSTRHDHSTENSTNRIPIENGTREASNETMSIVQYPDNFKKRKKSKDEAEVQKTIEFEYSNNNKSKSKKRRNREPTEHSPIENERIEATNETIPIVQYPDTIKKRKKLKVEAEVQETIESEKMDNDKSKSKKRRNAESTEHSKNSIPIKTKATNESIRTDKFKVQESVESETIDSKRQKSSSRNYHSTENSTNRIPVENRPMEASNDRIPIVQYPVTFKKRKKSKIEAKIQETIESENIVNNKSKSKKKRNGESTEHSKNSISFENGTTETTNGTIPIVQYSDTFKKKSKIEAEVQETIESENIDSNKSKSKKRRNGESTDHSKNSIPIENERIKATYEKIRTDKYMDTMKKEHTIEFNVQETIESGPVDTTKSKSKNERNYSTVQGNDSLQEKIPSWMECDTSSDSEMEQISTKNRNNKCYDKIDSTERSNSGTDQDEKVHKKHKKSKVISNKVSTSDERYKRQRDKDLKMFKEIDVWQNSTDFKQDAEDIQDMIEIINEEERLPDETIEKLKKLRIQLRHTVLPQHKIETHAGSHVPTKKQKEWFEQYHKIKSGSFTPEEDVIIIDNWKAFCKLHDLDRKDIKPFLLMRHDGNYYINKFEQRRKFVQFLADGLPCRMLYSVYHRFKNLFAQHLRNRYTIEDDRMIIAYMEKLSVNDEKNMRKCADLAKVLNRTRASIWRRYRLLKKKREENSKESPPRTVSELH